MLVMATGNAKKWEEARNILGHLYQVQRMSDLHIKETWTEDADSFTGNALIKARAVFEAVGKPVIADDSGLLVDALDGAPGVFSARYAGEHATDAQNVQRLLREMQGQENRNAHFATAIAYIDEGREYIFEGRVDGHITNEPRGNNGFGYDPVFVSDGYENTFAELPAETKNAISHRRRAFDRLLVFLSR